jgi:hypothetical protein
MTGHAQGVLHDATAPISRKRLILRGIDYAAAEADFGGLSITVPDCSASFFLAASLCAPAFVSTRGRVKQNVEPCPDEDRSQMRPPWSSMILRQIVRPSPLPPNVACG